MTTDLTDRPVDLMARHVDVLRGYAQRVLVDEVPLLAHEDLDRAARDNELVRIGTPLGCTEKEMVILVYGDLLNTRPSCECPACRGRRRPS